MTDQKKTLLRSIISIAANGVFFLVLNLRLYTDRAIFPDGQRREWQRSPLERLFMADEPLLFWLQVITAAVSVISSILLLCGVRGKALRIIQLASTIASAVIFVILMIFTSTQHASYA